MAVRINPAWDLNDPGKINVNADGTVTFKGPVGDVLLPNAYTELLLASDGLGTKDTNAWFVALFPAGAVILELEWLGGLSNAMSVTWGYADALDHDLPLLPEGYIFIGRAAPHFEDATKGEFDVLLCCLPDHQDYGKVFVWPRSPDPWMEGENTHGLGLVADTFSNFMNNLSPRAEL